MKKGDRVRLTQDLPTVTGHVIPSGMEGVLKTDTRCSEFPTLVAVQFKCMGYAVFLVDTFALKVVQ